MLRSLFVVSTLFVLVGCGKADPITGTAVVLSASRTPAEASPSPVEASPAPVPEETPGYQCVLPAVHSSPSLSRLAAKQAVIVLQRRTLGKDPLDDQVADATDAILAGRLTYASLLENQRFIIQHSRAAAEEVGARAFRALLGRDPSSSDIASWATNVQSAGFMYEDIVSNQLFLYLTNRIADRSGYFPTAKEAFRIATERTTGRTPSDAEANGAASTIIANHMTYADLISNNKYIFRTNIDAANDTATRAFKNLLGRDPNASDIASWRQPLIFQSWIYEDLVSNQLSLTE